MVGVQIMQILDKKAAMEGRGSARRAKERRRRVREKRRQAGRQAPTITCAVRRTNEAIPPNHIALSADGRRCIGTTAASSDPDPDPGTDQKMRGCHSNENQKRNETKLTLDGLHGVLHLEEAALGGPHRHVRVVLVAEHAMLA